jgi:hypothetical protein
MVQAYFLLWNVMAVNNEINKFILKFFKKDKFHSLLKKRICIATVDIFLELFFACFELLFVKNPGDMRDEIK